MTIIHHATAKKAASLGITLELTADEQAVMASGTSKKVYIATSAKIALVVSQTAETIRTEYPAIELRALNRDHWCVYHGEDEILDLTADDVSTYDDLLADILEAVDEAGVDPSDGVSPEDEEAEARIVVHPRYKVLYAERGNRNHCGDWLASTLEGEFDKAVNGALRLDTDAFTQFLIENGVEMVGKWASLPESGQPGWVGRYRMNGRQKLEVRVALTGILKLRGTEIQVPEDALNELREKHAKALGKIEKKAK